MVDDVRPSAIAPVVDVAHLWSRPAREPEPPDEQTEYLVTVTYATGVELKKRGPFPDLPSARIAVKTHNSYQSGSRWDDDFTAVTEDGTRFTIVPVSGLPGYEERRALGLAEADRRRELLRAAEAEREAAEDDDEPFEIDTGRAVSLSRGAPGERNSRVIPQDVKIAVSVRDQGECVQCGSTDDLHFDHKVPWSRGGTNTVHNIQLLCGPCNRRKGADDIPF